MIVDRNEFGGQKNPANGLVFANFGSTEDPWMR